MPNIPGHLASLADVVRWDSVPWRLKAACRYVHHSSWWFNNGQTKHDRNIQRKAKSICHTCPMRWQCLARYLDEPAGIFGGFDEDQRREMRSYIPLKLRHRPALLRAWLIGEETQTCGTSTVTIRSSVG